MTQRPGNALAVMAHRVTPTGGANFFPSQPWSGRAGGEVIARLDPRAHRSRGWECACGMGSLAFGLEGTFGSVVQSDLYLYDGNRIHDFIGKARPPFGAVDWIVTNPPFDEIAAFIRQALRRARRGVALLLPMRALEGVERHELLYGAHPVTAIAPFSERLPMHQGVYDPDRSTAAFYGWFIWLKPALRPERFMARIPDGRGGVQLKPATIDIGPGTKRRLFRREDLRFAVNATVRETAARLIAAGERMSAGKWDLLEKVAREEAGRLGGRGVTAQGAVMPGGLLASLRNLGLLEHAPPLKGDFGDRRFRVTEAGAAFLAEAGRL